MYLKPFCFTKTEVHVRSFIITGVDIHFIYSYNEAVNKVTQAKPAKKKAAEGQMVQGKIVGVESLSPLRLNGSRTFIYSIIQFSISHEVVSP